MPRPARSSSRNGNRSTHAGGRRITRDWVRPGDAVLTVPVFSNPSGKPVRRCPTCDLDVPTKADGTIRGHRIGSKGNSWPCPGDDAAPRR